MNILAQIELSDVKVKQDESHIHFQQNDPITGALNWVAIPITELTTFVNFLNNITCQ